MAKNGDRIPGLEEELDDKIRQAQDTVRRAHDGVKSEGKRHEKLQRQADAFRAGLAKITGEPAPFIAAHLKGLERTA
ncbi:MAG: hypothetical protein HY060_08120, partial [Proteobacteria bacterium]|nr:hypothetical protein [Pseudomonadota bacterium]